MTAKLFAGGRTCMHTAMMLLLFGGFLLLAPAAQAVLQVSISEPAEGTEVTPGQKINVSYTAGNPVAGLEKVMVAMEGYGTQTATFLPNPPTNSDSYTYEYIIPNRPAGTQLTITVTAYGYVDDPVSAVRHVVIKDTAPDTAAPTWAGAATTGAKAATRQPGNTSALVEWYQASDNKTAASAIKYNVYMAQTASELTNPLPGTPLMPTAVRTGELSTTVTGLDRTKTYYFMVRAKDEANNVDANTVVVSAAPLPNAVSPKAWSLYE